MMRKNVCYLLAVLYFLPIFTACNDDKEETFPDTHYAGKNLVMTVNGETIEDQSVNIMWEGYGNKGKYVSINFYAIVVGNLNTSVVAQVIETENGYDLQGELKQGTFDIAVNGKITTTEVLILDINYTNNSPLVGAWSDLNPYVKVNAEKDIQEVIQSTWETILSPLQVLELCPSGWINIIYLDTESTETKKSERYTYYYSENERIILDLKTIRYIWEYIPSRTSIYFPLLFSLKYKINKEEIKFIIDKEVIRSLEKDSLYGPVREYIEKLLDLSIHNDLELGFTMKRI